MTDERRTFLSTLIDKHRDLVLSAERWLWAHPETGYKEWKSHAYMAEAFEALGYTLKKAGDIPGFTTDLDTGRPGPCVLILGELDSLRCEDHPDADPDTGAVHACGHHAQCAALLGVAAALKEPGALDDLCGTIRLCAVPAEELIEVAYREELRKQGIIKYFGGKVEFLHRGYFDGVDMAFMVHTQVDDQHLFSCNRGNNGCVTKNITYHGLASHASAPWNAINALYAANLGMNAINALRETFNDQDHIRVHPIITAGGTVVNAIPSEVKMESYVRGASIDAIMKANQKVNRALSGAAAAMGAGLTLCDRCGYSPLVNHTGMMNLGQEVLQSYLPADEIKFDDTWGSGCTDMGDLSAVMPAFQPYVSGACGVDHGKDYGIADPDQACVESARFQLLYLHRLLENDAAAAKEILASEKPLYESFGAYFADMERLVLDKNAVIVQNDGTVVLDDHNA